MLHTRRFFCGGDRGDDGGDGGAGDPIGVDRGNAGNGQVVSLASPVQNGRIFSYRYHCLDGDRPVGSTTIGSSDALGLQVGSFK